MELTQYQKDEISKLQKDNELETDLLYIIENSNAENIDDLTEYIDEQTNGFQVEIIYYANAIKYLTDNDASLQYSLEIANELGYETKNLNSELLASLLASQNEREHFDDIKDALNDLLFTDKK